jgi:rhodanese-related sulfurtransferase
MPRLALSMEAAGSSVFTSRGLAFQTGTTGEGHMSQGPARVSYVTAPALKAMLRDGDELALLDLREEGVFATAHLLFAVPLPLSRLELGIAALVPRRTVRVVLCDAGDGLAERAGERLARHGYADLAILQGGIAAWREAGYELFSGVHVPSKAFGEFIEHAAGTPRLPAEAVKARLDEGADMVILDSRPIDEYRNMSIPGGIDCPGAELVYRVHDLVRSPDTLVVVNCAGRTRSIIGAQSLIDAGLRNPVVALENGTMGWHLAGLALDRGQERRAPAPSPAGLAKARQAAERVAGRYEVPVIGEEVLDRFRAQAAQRTLYLLDVRSPEEYAAGHRPGARSAPGGQLVQATDAYVGTRNARLVLTDGDGVRARMTASWLIRMGWPEVYVLDAPMPAALETGPEPRTVLGLDAVQAEAVGAAELARLLERGAVLVVDLDSSLAFRAGHIPGAWFAIRARLATSVVRLPGDGAIVLTSRDGVLARLAAPELAALTTRPVKVLEGGTAAWRAAGLPLDAGEEHMADAPEDAWYKPYDRARDVEAAMRDYLRWEVDLVGQIERDGDARFRHVPAA